MFKKKKTNDLIFENEAKVQQEKSKNKIITAIQNTIQEGKEITWPETDKVLKHSGVVLFFVLVVGAILFLILTIITPLINLLLK